MNNNMVGFVVGLALTVIILGSVLAPAISGIQNENVTEYENEGGATFTINGVEDFTIYNTSGRIWVINGESVNVGSDYKGPLVTTDKFVFTKTDNNGRYMVLRDATGDNISGGDANTYLFKIVYTASTNTAVYTKYTDLTETTVDVTYTYSCSHVIEYDPAGDYVSISSDGSVAPSGYYVNSLSDVVCGGAYTSGTLDTAYFARGETVDLGVSDYSGSATATTSSVLDDVMTVSDYTVTVTDGTTTESFVPYTIYVPAVVVGHTGEQSLQNTLYGVILTIVVTCIVAASALMLYRRD